MRVDLTGRTALVTGGGTGIGFGCAQSLAAAGATVTLTGRRVDVLEQAAERLGPATRVVRADVTEEDEVAHAVAIASDGGRLDVMVANAGTASPGAIVEMGAADWDIPLRLNVIGTALCFKHAALNLRRHGGGGSLIAISSTSATKVQPWMASYASSKAALDMLVRCAAVELSADRIRVNGIQPGYVPTEMAQAFFPPVLQETITRATPLGRAGVPSDVGQLAVFLAGDESAWITGQLIGVDGGLNVPVMPSMAPLAGLLFGDEHVASVGLPDLVGLRSSGTDVP